MAKLADLPNMTIAVYTLMEFLLYTDGQTIVQLLFFALLYVPHIYLAVKQGIACLE